MHLQLSLQGTSSPTAGADTIWLVLKTLALPPRPWTISWRIVRSIVQKEFVDKFTNAVVPPKKFSYCTSAIISRGLYIFYPTFHCSFYYRAVNITDNLRTIHKEILQFLALKSVVYNQEWFQIKRGYNGAGTVYISLVGAIKLWKTL